MDRMTGCPLPRMEEKEAEEVGFQIGAERGAVN
jgi:hypothetical protein